MGGRIKHFKSSVLCVQRMASLVERLRARSDRKPLYNLDDSDDEAIVRDKSKGTQEQVEKFVRPDAVYFFSSSSFMASLLYGCSSMIFPLYISFKK